MDYLMIDKTNKDNVRIADIAAKLSEHFTDYVVIARVKDGLVWRFSDRTFAIGSVERLKDRLTIDDRLIIEKDEGHDTHDNH